MFVVPCDKLGLGALGGGDSVGNAINDGGQVAGWSYTAGGVDVHATLWQNTAAIDLGTLGGSLSQAYGINKAGQVVGYSALANNAAYHATIWNDTTAIDLNTVLDSSGKGVELITAAAINDPGQIVGEMAITVNGNTNVRHAFLLTPINGSEKDEIGRAHV